MTRAEFAKFYDDQRAEMTALLERIGGLENGIYDDRPPITTPGFLGVGVGWYPLIADLIKKLVALGWDKQVCQVKQKFGGLRFYINSGSEQIHELIDQAQRKSHTICEHCGQPGDLRAGSWDITLCGECDVLR
jgi:hypothetical protein